MAKVAPLQSHPLEVHLKPASGGVDHNKCTMGVKLNLVTQRHVDCARIAEFGTLHAVDPRSMGYARRDRPLRQ